MAKYKKLLVAVDGSKSSLHALEESFRLSKEGTLVVSVAPPFTVDLKIGAEGEIQKMLQEPCETALTKASEMGEAAAQRDAGLDHGFGLFPFLEESHGFGVRVPGLLLVR